MIPKIGIHENVPFKQYLEWEAFSGSGVSYLLKSAMHYKYWSEHNEQTEAQRIGSLIDCIVLTPDNFAKDFVMTPEVYTNAKNQEKPFTLRSNTCKQIMKNIRDSGKVAVTQFEFNEAQRVKDEVFSHPIARELLLGGRQQVSVVWRDSDHDVLCKARFDNLRDIGIDDLKSTIDGSPDSFSYTINKYKYHVQGALYSDAFDILQIGSQYPPEYNIIAVEKKPPYAVSCYGLEPSTLLTGRSLYKRAMIIYKEAKESGKWLGYSQFLEPVEIPAWALQQNLDDEVLNA